MKVLRLGHATYVLTSKAGNRYMMDPFLSMNPGCPEEYTTPEFLSSLSAVFITHGHFDHTGSLDELMKHHPELPIVCQYDLGLIFMQKGYKKINLLNFGGSIDFDDVRVSMVQAMHTSSYAETEGPPMYAGQPAGFVFTFQDDQTLYHSGDTTMMSDMKLIQDFYQPTIAILSSSGQLVMGPEEAAYVVKNLLDVRYVIPNHQFPTHDESPRPEVLDQMLGQFQVIETMMNTDAQLQHLLQDYDKTEVIMIPYGGEKEF